MKKRFSVRTTILAASLLFELGSLCSQSHAAPGDVDLSFDTGSSITSVVSVVAVQPDGKVLVGGPLTFINGTNRFGRARLNVDGSVDSTFLSSSFNPDLADVIPNDCPALPNQCVTITVPECSAVQANGKVLVGGYSFTTEPSFDGDTYYYRYFLARFHANGSRDTSFEPAVGDPRHTDWEKETVRALAVQSDGKVVVGGIFFSMKGTNRIGIARLNANGSLDNSFVPDIVARGGFPAASEVYSVASQPDGKVLLAGYSFTVNGTNYPTWIVRLDDNGSLDLGFNRSFSRGAIELQPDGKVLVGLSRLNADGSLDSSFDAGTGANGSVNSIALQPDGKVLVGGAFTRINGTNCNRVARLNANGSLDGGFQVVRGVEIPVSSLVVQPDGKVLIGGPLTFINGTNRYGRDRLNPNGSLDGTFISNTFNPDLGFVIQAGDCRGGPDFECSQSWVVSVVRVQPDGKVLVGGYSATVDIDLFDNHPFNSYRSFLARLHADGSRDTSFAPVIGPLLDVPLGVSALAMQPDGKVLFGGFMVEFGRRNADGSPDNTFNPVITGRHWVASIALQADGKLVIGGDFSTLHGTNVSYGVARLHADGSLDGSFNPGTGRFGVLMVALQPDDKVVIGGSFTSFNGTARNRIARLNANGSLDFSFNPGTGADGNVSAIALQPDGNILIGGAFTTVNGVGRPYVARLYGDAVAPSLNIARSNALMIISWPVTGLNFQLQEATNLSLPNSWSPVAQSAVTNAGQISVTVPTSAGRIFFRLKSQ